MLCRHGVKQTLSCWADGVAFITQCPIQPGQKFVYKFKLSGQEGTLWWHAHLGFYRATVYGAIVIYPKVGTSYPFSKPDEEQLIILGEWWNRNVTELQDELDETGVGPDSSDANLINGFPGDMYSCSLSSDRRRRFLKNQENSSLELSDVGSYPEPGTFRLKVTSGKTYLLRIISASLNPCIFFKIANHNMVIVATDASYTNPFSTDVIIISPGQTIDVLLTANQPPGLYYMTTSVFVNSHVQFRDIPGTAILEYEDVGIFQSVPKLPNIPSHYDRDLFYNSMKYLTSLVSSPFWTPVPLEVDENMFITIGLGFQPCNSRNPNQICAFLEYRMAGSLSNITFKLPTKMSILEAHYNKVDGIYTNNFPNNPPLTFNFTDERYMFDLEKLMTELGTKVKRLKYNSTVEIVFQSTTLFTAENHPMHLHGFNFHILGHGFGNYSPLKHQEKLNLVNPVLASTVSVPGNGWVVIRFRANNPGVWFLHCHNEGHLAIGLATVFIVEDGPTSSTSLPKPPEDYPRC
ncbi:hypothetical protein Leryth_019675 [Lithospermum erythrorhizon]|nr:hypothetical protein Leryth_019675 [Lithospermum erythrorhizon]